MAQLKVVQGGATPVVSREAQGIRPEDLPAPPAAALALLQACSAANGDTRRLVALVEGDARLTAALLRMVNSAWFGLSRPVRSVSRAIAVIGERALRNLVLCFAVRGAISEDQVHGLDLEPYWEAALRRGIAARVFGARVDLSADECFVVGMVQDLGLLALLHAHPEHVGVWSQLLAADPEQRYALERDVFGTTHEEVGSALALAWHLPEDVAEIIASHHGDLPEDVPDEVQPERLRAVAQIADWVAALAGADDRFCLRRQVARYAERALGVDARETEELIARVEEDFAEASEAAEVEVGQAAADERAREEASRQLAENALDAEALNWRLHSALEERERLSAQRFDELERARSLQRTLFPPPPLAGGEGCPCFGINAPARILSGDLYDYFPLAEGRWHFAIADVSGKGVAAALMMARVSSLYRCLARRLHDPARLLTLLNAEISATAAQGMFVTMVVGVIDPAAGTVRLSNAGHPPPLLFDTSGSFEAIPAYRPPLAVLPDTVYTTSEHRLSGGALYLFTDGLLEAPGHGGERLGYAGIAKLLRSQANLPAPRRLARVLTWASRSHDLSGDDVTVLLIEAPGG